MAGTFNLNAGAPAQAAPSRVYTELRIQTHLLCEIYRVLTLLSGQSQPLVSSGMAQCPPADLSSDVDAWRNDPTFQGP